MGARKTERTPPHRTRKRSRLKVRAMRTTSIKKGRWQATLVQRFSLNHNRVLLLMLVAASSGAGLALLSVAAAKLIGGAP
jgi:hypothetical protein